MGNQQLAPVVGSVVSDRGQVRIVGWGLVLLAAVGIALLVLGVRHQGLFARNPAVDALERHQAQWDAHRPASYRFTFAESGTVLGVAHVVTVHPGHRVTVSPPYRDGELGPTSIDEVFDLAESGARGADQASASFDPHYGYPTGVNVDPSRGTIDDEYGLGVSNFVVLVPPSR